MTGLLQSGRGTVEDLRGALATLRRRPGHTLHVVATLALGLGAFAGLLAYLSYFKRPLIEAPSPDTLVWVFRNTPEAPRGGLSQPDVTDLAGQGVAGLDRIAGWRAFGAAVGRPERTVHGWGHAVTGEFFDLFGATPWLGRLLGPADDRPGAPPVLVVGHRFWRTHLGADAAIVGTDVLLDGRHRFTIVGVAQPGFQGPALGMSLYVPLHAAGAMLPGTTDREAGSTSVLARRAPGASPALVANGLAAAARTLDAAAPLEAPRRLDAVAVADYNPWAPDDPLVRGAEGLTLAVGCLLALACTNIATLMLAATIARRRDLAVRAAIGASPLRLGRQLFFEGLLLALAGGLLGLPLVRPVLALIERYLVDSVPVGMGEWARDTHLVVDPWLIGGLSLLLVIVVAIVTTVAPVLAAARQDVVSGLQTDAGGSAPGRWLGRRTLVAGQVALSVTLLTGTAMFLQTLRGASAAPLGFDPAGRYLATVHVPAGIDAATPAALFGTVLDDVRRLPGVRAASLVARVPGGMLPMDLRVRGPGGAPVGVTANVIAGGYFDALGIPVREGRDFDDRDAVDGAPAVALVSAMAAERLWPGQGAVGQRLEVHTAADAPPEPLQVVGVVGDSLTGPPARPFEPHVYRFYRQTAVRRLTLVVAADGALPGRLHELLRQHHPDLAVLDLQPFAEQLRRGLADQRLNADFAGGLGVLGLLMAVQGLYSLMSYSVARRRREIGLRKALGADAASVGRLVLGEAARLIATGLVLGAAGAVVFSRVLASRVAGLEPGRPANLAAALAILAVFGTLAALGPALRAMRVAPAASLRSL
ncbi:MAG: ABC transporter permease [Vicinamibacterales bacterium]